MHWLAHFFGVANGDGNSSAYLWWSGPGSDLAYLTVLAGFIAAYRKHNCQVKRCPRIGRHEFTDDAGVKRTLCWKHHPAVESRQLTRERLHLYLGQRPGRG